jgi:hypothetical protein
MLELAIWCLWWSLRAICVLSTCVLALGWFTAWVDVRESLSTRRTGHDAELARNAIDGEPVGNWLVGFSRYADYGARQLPGLDRIYRQAYAAAETRYRRGWRRSAAIVYDIRQLELPVQVASVKPRPDGSPLWEQIDSCHTAAQLAAARADSDRSDATSRYESMQFTWDVSSSIFYRYRTNEDDHPQGRDDPSRSEQPSFDAMCERAYTFTPRCDTLISYRVRGSIARHPFLAFYPANTRGMFPPHHIAEYWRPPARTAVATVLWHSPLKCRPCSSPAASLAGANHKAELGTQNGLVATPDLVRNIVQQTLGPRQVADSRKPAATTHAQTALSKAIKSDKSKDQVAETGNTSGTNNDENHEPAGPAAPAEPAEPGGPHEWSWSRWKLCFPFIFCAEAPSDTGVSRGDVAATARDGGDPDPDKQPPTMSNAEKRARQRERRAAQASADPNLAMRLARASGATADILFV